MGRPKKLDHESSLEPNPEVTERKRLKRLAFGKGILAETPAKVREPLSPSKAVIKHHGKDIVKKSQRKNKFLFSFPGLLAPLGGGKIGELKDLGSKNPVLYLDFPQGRMKLFGTILYPKNRYLTLQFPRSGKNVMCEDYFDNMIAFSEAWWIGKKDENPQEAQLNFPNELDEGEVIESDFKGGAGAASVNKPDLHKSGMVYADEPSPKAEVEVDLSDDESNLKDAIEATPVRHSQRTAGRAFNFAEASSGDDSIESDADVSEGKENKVVAVDSSATKHKDRSYSDKGSLVQATISTLFKKVEEKKAPRNSRRSPSQKDC